MFSDYSLLVPGNPSWSLDLGGKSVKILTLAGALEIALRACISAAGTLEMAARACLGAAWGARNGCPAHR